MSSTRLQKIGEYYKQNTSRATFYLLFWLDFKDPVTWSLLFANLVTATLALVQNWSITNLLIVFWIQCLIIGIFHLLRMLSISNETIAESMIVDPKKNNQIKNPQLTKLVTIIFYIIFYTSFLSGTFIILILFRISNLLDEKIYLDSILISSLLFLANHAYSFFRNRAQDREANIGIMLFLPFLRTFPMQAVIWTAFLTPVNILPVFLIIKTFVDLKSYHWERIKYEKPTEEDKRRIIEDMRRIEGRVSV